MKKNEKYYGEIWFETREDEKQFAIITFEDDDLLIETNLYSDRLVYTEPKILGSFTGLGYITFIDCDVQLSSSGLIETRIYQPKFAFISNSNFIDPQNTKISEFSIINDAIVHWVDHAPRYNPKEEKIIRKEFIDDFIILEKKLTIKINHYIKINNKRTELNIQNTGAVIFNIEKPVRIVEAIEIYSQFQKVLQFLFGHTSKFKKFSFKCVDCGQVQELYYNENEPISRGNSYVRTRYRDIKEDLNTIFNAAYLNGSFQFCLDKLLENFTSRPNHSRRFTNSLTAYEAFMKVHFSKKKMNLARDIRFHKDVFILIGKITEDKWGFFPQKVVRSRDYHIHSNFGNKDIFSEFELLYISYLFDFVIGYLLLKTIVVSDSLLNKFVIHGNSVFIEMQSVNKMLGENSLLDENR